MVVLPWSCDARGDGAFGPITPGEHEEALAEWETAAVAPS
jgi:hypothetical protein